MLNLVFIVVVVLESLLSCGSAILKKNTLVALSKDVSYSVILFELFLKNRNVGDDLERFTKKDDIAKPHHSCHLLLLKEAGFRMRVLFK